MRNLALIILNMFVYSLVSFFTWVILLRVFNLLAIWTVFQGFGLGFIPPSPVPLTMPLAPLTMLAGSQDPSKRKSRRGAVIKEKRGKRKGRSYFIFLLATLLMGILAVMVWKVVLSGEFLENCGFHCSIFLSLKMVSPKHHWRGGRKPAVDKRR